MLGCQADQLRKESRTENRTEPGTEPRTEPGTEPRTEPGTEPRTEPRTEPTEPRTKSRTEPHTERCSLHVFTVASGFHAPGSREVRELQELCLLFQKATAHILNTDENDDIQEFVLLRQLPEFLT
ncbi:hypothetical protein WMY93_017486 [Mugilogobius chulae]|uniref:Uncharacterized protein n=1 Tax=Mugilogobius chulae TaxID=88201 RepID=A0AAW0P0I0_9GOBI